MKPILLALALIAVAGAASAQTRPNPASAAGTAGVKARVESLGYKGVHDLRRGPNGQWVGKATQGNIEKSVTIYPRGNVIAR